MSFCNTEQIPELHRSRRTPKANGPPEPRLLRQNSCGRARATGPRLGGTQQASAFAVPRARLAAGSDALSVAHLRPLGAKKNPRYPPVGSDPNTAGSCLVEKSYRRRRAARAHLEEALWPDTGQPQPAFPRWPCVGLTGSLTQPFLPRSARQGRQRAREHLGCLIFQGSLKPGENLFATRRRTQHANTVLSAGQAGHTAENYFLHVKNIPMAWNKQN